ncbi:nitrate- and nitrite sensing domain-containing protein [Nocardia sp. NEAU-351]|uniref:histidine kinase n=2 Tax=Nocardia bovistercoris TaxID=2785916 RepID=A0A931IH50_9NOCA|nr:nitrate- and nitrite sensing domain-containing protein [Nocardia bovistercoris]MBH0780285.1 nitrate- and nitrite sensing domain-containing protein [Nocardia bovistercoris]
MVSALLGVIAVGQVEKYRGSGDTVEAVELGLAVQDLLHETQRERGLTNGWLGGDGRLRNSVVDQRGNTDRALAALEAAMAQGPSGADRVASAAGQFAPLAATRTQIDAGRIPRAAAFQYYTDGINALNHLRLGLDEADDPEVRHALQSFYALGEAKEQTARERGFLNGVFSAEGFAPGEYVQFLDIRAAKTAGLAAFARDATPRQQTILDTAMGSENALRAGESEKIAIDSAAGPLIAEVDPIAWWSQMTAVIDDQRTVQRAVGAAVTGRAHELRRAAAYALAGFGAAALLAVAMQIALVVGSMRAIVRPLAALADEADDVAGQRLPTVIDAWHDAGEVVPDPPTPVRTPDGASVEIAAVAHALDRVQTTAVELASAQAVMRRNSTDSMANLARRNQNLVRRQLGLISEFERAELDPKALSNLFELDHLATRMRRNAESLLVLVGEASPRRWTSPIPLTDVIRAALSEVDDYRRVMLRRIDDVSVAGSVVSELAHMLAELIENGLAFSPPDLEVEIYGRKQGKSYLLAVVDHGVGMPEDHLAEANARLRGERDFMVAPTRYLGHYVVGRLARRLKVGVELNTSPVSGIVARLLLPPEILDGYTEPVAESDVVEPAESVSSQSVSAESVSAELSLLTFSDGASAGPADHPVAEPAARERRRAPAAANGQAGLAAALDIWNGPGPAHAVGRPRTEEVPTPPTADEIAAPATLAPPARSATTGVATGQLGAPGSNGRGGPDGSEHGKPAAEVRGPSKDGADAGPEPASRQWWQVSDEAESEADTTQSTRRTKNGLVKRNKRIRGTDAVAARPMPPRPPRTPVPERSPEEVRGMLSAFRTGTQRAAPAPATPQSPARPAAAPPGPLETMPLPHRAAATAAQIEPHAPGRIAPRKPLPGAGQGQTTATFAPGPAATRTPHSASRISPGVAAAPQVAGQVPPPRSSPATAWEQARDATAWEQARDGKAGAARRPGDAPLPQRRMLSQSAPPPVPGQDVVGSETDTRAVDSARTLDHY